MMLGRLFHLCWCLWVVFVGASSSSRTFRTAAGGCIHHHDVPARNRRRRLRSSLPLVRGGAAATVTATANKKIADPAKSVGASIPNEVLNLIKSIVGAGVLGLPAGIAAWGDSPSALLPAMALLVGIGCMSAFGFYSIGSVCAFTSARSYRQAWTRSVGVQTSWIPALACMLVTLGAVVTYSMILATTVPTLLANTGIRISRTTALGLVTLSLVPLCIQQELSKLAPFSALGTAGTIYTMIAMVYRWLSGSYSKGSSLLSEVDASLQPRFGTTGWKAALSSNKLAILVSMLSTAFQCHYNAPKFYYELKQASLPRYAQVVLYSFGGAMLLMATIAAAGFGTFGASSQSLILNNYALSDPLMTISRAAITVSLFFTYPLAFVGVREQVLDLFQVNDTSQRQQLSTPLSLGILAAVTGLAFVLTDIRVMLAIGGSTYGNCVIYLFPSVMLWHAAKKFPSLRSNARLAMFNGILGLGLGIVGTYQAVAMIRDS